MEIAERFASKTMPEPTSGCVLWTAFCDADGYGHFWNGQKMVLAHRYAYDAEVATIPDGLCVLHRCDTPPCVNPAHLFIGTDADNVADSVAKGRRGSERYAYKLTLADVREIRERATGRWGEQTEIARKYGVARCTVSRILGGRRWT